MLTVSSLPSSYLNNVVNDVFSKGSGKIKAEKKKVGRGEGVREEGK